MSHVLREFLDSYYRLRPVNATFTGLHDYDHRLPDWSPDGLSAAAAEMTAVRTASPPGRRLPLRFTMFTSAIGSWRSRFSTSNWRSTKAGTSFNPIRRSPSAKRPLLLLR
jgi:hypothetical protein